MSEQINETEAKASELADSDIASGEEITNEQLAEETEPVAEGVEFADDQTEPLSDESEQADDIPAEQEPIEIDEQTAEDLRETNDYGDLTIESIIEAILFATDEPISAERISNIAEFNGGLKQIKECIANLNQQYIESCRAFRIEEIAGGFQMMTLPEYNVWLKKLLRQRTDNKLTPAALETLAIIAYKQPIIRANVESIRGVACGEMIRALMYKGMVKIVGKAEILGRPLLYGTTKKFLEVFGLATIKDLPKVEELKRPNQ